METSIEKRVAELENLVFLSKNVLSFDEASKFLNLSKSYLYKLTSGNLIPHYKPQGKMLYFEKAELEAWLRQNPVKTQAQIEQEAQKYILNRPFRWMVFQRAAKSSFCMVTSCPASVAFLFSIAAISLRDG
jgi:excisionase family DNA binding protein